MTDQRMRAETNKLLAEMFKVAAEQRKFNAEAPKMTCERAWYPPVAMFAAAAVGAALAILLTRFTG